ncbi:SDR family NAD(P)-dependent oxidoreductase [Pelomonas sp. SE-A7]|uniref:SDR family NAD(P)-dependent oxidoreductase n=1 Tax=Pelomonas sp. SE-A7 TaxID=3054953 RepID=UPI00259CB719|nr:SDR family NAD(P)-dependent oxidoreductase [Pelomonas sp. SE-A7]MDM4767078.1 SDR family NAD(P)-dependent oxidoreductase [Pelomonas sp. SE-A7]
MSAPSSHLFIVTGSSRGLGAALVERLLASPGNQVLGIARRTGPGHERLTQWSLDLAQPLAAAQQLQAWLAQQARPASATLINNAALLNPPGPVEGVELAALSDGLRVGLEATLLLSSAFLRAARPWGVPLKILNISSGLGRRAMAGAAPYCAAKAGMDNLSASMALDEAQRADGARVVSLAPGIIDTDMQVQLRAADPAGFPDHGNFVGYKSSGALASPVATAAKILAYLARSDFGHQAIADIRQA